MASFDQKLRTLRLMEILLERTDDEHMHRNYVQFWNGNMVSVRTEELYIQRWKFLINLDWISSRRRGKILAIILGPEILNCRS